MKRVNINDLPDFSNWAGRLLGVSPFNKPKRDMAKIEAEWELDKYAKLLYYYYQHPDATPTELENYVLEQVSIPIGTMGGDICISKKGSLFLVPYKERRALTYENLSQTLAKSIAEVGVVIELGCGFGYNFYALSQLLPEIFPIKEWIGGEYSQNAVELARRVFRNTNNVAVVPFNYYDKEWAIFESLKEPSVVFTRHSIEQLPQSKDVILTLSKYKEKIKKVIHFEPAVELTDDGTLLGMMRRAYTQINDYNTDLLSAITNAGGRITKSEADVIGVNPLNPTSLVEWEF